MIGQTIQPRIVAPPPPFFADTFVTGGWRAIEKTFGASTPVLLRWIEMSGGKALLARRAAAQTCGRKAGGHVAVNAASVQG